MLTCSRSRTTSNKEVEQAVEQGSSKGEKGVLIEEESITVLGQGSDLDTLVASAKAYINGEFLAPGEIQTYLTPNLSKTDEIAIE